MTLASPRIQGPLLLPCLSHLRLATGYRTSQQDLINEFYVPCLTAAIRYDRAAGYFRSTLYIMIGVALSDFAQRGGLVRLVCSPHLFTEDVAAIRAGLDQREHVNEAFRRSLEACLHDPTNRPVAQLLSTLVAFRALDVKLALRPSSTGIFHDKVGLFKDGDGHRVSFLGSANETYSAWHPDANHEGFEVFRDWISEDAKERVDRHQAYFERLWEGREPGIDVHSLSEVSHDFLALHADPDGVDASAHKVRRIVAQIPFKPVVVSVNGITLQSHQLDAVAGWEAQDCRGMLEHATGSGKTITALEVIRRWITTGRPALVLVPSDLLASQWRREAQRYLGDVVQLQVGGDQGDPNWRDHLSDATRNAPELGPRLTIATVQTASGDDFLQRIKGGEQLLVVGDEVHRLGAPHFSRTLSIPAKGRLGLSATPRRYGDPAGTAKILDYFGAVVPPPFTLKDAIEAGRLVPYDYFVHPVPLTGDEQDSWDKLTGDIGVEFAKSGHDTHAPMSERLKMLLILRARIIKKAAHKVALARQIVGKYYSDEDRWLIYCDDTEQLQEVLVELRSAGFQAFEYHSSMMGDKDATLEHFTHSGGIVVAIKCLDEGIDIPAVNKALILASSTNPREYIQRRGRVLRRAEGKLSAEVHDALVLPVLRDAVGISTRPIVATELRRSLQFATTARNSSTLFQLRSLAARYGINLERAGLENTTDVESEE